MIAVTIAMFGVLPAVASAGTYSYTETIPVPPASSYAGSGGGDGWAVAMTPEAVYNVFHHSSQLRVACHLQRDASACWSPKTIRDDAGNDFRVSGQPGLYLDQDSLDQKKGRLYVYATRDEDDTAGVVCIDTNEPAETENPFCGFTVLTPGGDAPSNSGVSNSALVGTRLYAFNYVDGASVEGGRNRLLCFDTSTGGACAGQPFTVALGGDTVSASSPSYRVPAVSAIGSKVIVPVDAGGERLACFDGGNQATCAGSWPAAAAAGYSQTYGAPFPTLSPSGEVTGLCLPTQGIPCYDLSGASVATPAGISGVINPGQPWNGPAVTIGPRVYVPNGSGDVVQCFDFSTASGCANFPKSLPGAGYLYSVNPDPQRPDCLWVNADNGSAQIQNFDAYTGGACGEGPIRVLASRLIVPTEQCRPTSYTSLEVIAPERNKYGGGSVKFLDGSGAPIPGAADRPIDGNGTVSLSGLDLSTSTGLPQFLIALTDPQGDPTAVIVKLTWQGPDDPSCIKPQTDTRQYQAIGDSYSAGFGNAPFQPGTNKDGGPNDCQRSSSAYSQIVSAHYDLNLAFNACQGALTKDFYEGRVRDSSWGEEPQLNHLNDRTGLVTFSIGGNDAHFVPVVKDCILGYELLPFNTCNADDRIANPVNEAIDRLAGRTTTPTDITPYDKIFKDVRRKAPYARRVVVGYPDFFPEDGSDRTFLPGGRCEGIKKVDQRWIVEQIQKVDKIIKDAARRNGFRYADPVSRFRGHELCSGGTEWLGGALADNRFHPTVAGQDALARAVIEALDDRFALGGAYTVNPGDTVRRSFAVPLGQERLTIVAQWPGSDIPLTLISPSGTRYTRDAPGAGVKHEVGPTFEQFEVPTPEPGEWQFELYGKEVDAGGELTTVLPTTEPFENAPPQARISYVENPDGTLTFSSAQSTDGDGQITRREWYISTGSNDEDRSEGETVTIPKDAGGKNVSLVVTDDRGDTSFASAVIPLAAQPGQNPPPGSGGGTGATPVLTPAGRPLPPASDRTPPKLTELALQTAIRKGRRTTWKRTRIVKGRVRLHFRLSEPATVTLSLNSARTPKKRRTKTIRAKAGATNVDVRRLTRRLSRGPAQLSITAKDVAGNVTKRTLKLRR